MMSLHRIKFLMDVHLHSAFQFLWLHRALHIQPFTDTFIHYVIYTSGATCSARAATVHTLTTTHSGAIWGSVSHNNGVKTTYMESKSRPFEGNKTLKKSIYLPTPLFIIQKWNFCKGARGLLVHFPFTRSSNRHMTQNSYSLEMFCQSTKQ